jgi:hypothetical protein
MPFTAKGRKVINHLRKEYGQKRGTSVFYAMINKGKLSGAERKGHKSR